jgi:hypothetical protein
MSTARTLLNALIGAVVATVLSFVPLSTLLGGAVAGFLEGPDERQGSIAGGIAGILMFVPFAGFSLLVLAFLGFGIGLAGFPAEAAVFSLLFVIFVVAVLGYTVGFALVGGYLGAVLAREYPDHHANVTDSLGASDHTATRQDTFDSRDQ